MKLSKSFKIGFFVGRIKKEFPFSPNKGNYFNIKRFALKRNALGSSNSFHTSYAKRQAEESVCGEAKQQYVDLEEEFDNLWREAMQMFYAEKVSEGIALMNKTLMRAQDLKLDKCLVAGSKSSSVALFTAQSLFLK